MWDILVYNRKDKEYMLVETVKASNRGAAIENWRGENPKRAMVVDSAPYLSLVALLDPGGI
jgi:hypothetical protein